MKIYNWWRETFDGWWGAVGPFWVMSGLALVALVALMVWSGNA